MSTSIESQVSPAYVDRKFYGPLALATGMPQNIRRHMLAHPSDKTKMIREGHEGTYVDQAEMDERVFATQQVLDGLTRHGVNHVNPAFINDTGMNNKPNLLTVVTLHENSIPYGNLLRKGLLSDEQVFEADYVIGSMLEYLAEVIDEGGYVDAEMMRLKQFVYDDSQPQGKKMVLVDVEPLDGSKVDRNEESVSDDGAPNQMTRSVLRLVTDIINLCQKAGTRDITSLEKMATIVASLPGESTAVNAMKAAILRALDNRTVSAISRYSYYIY